MIERIRTTISLPQDVYEVFKQMADVSGTSVSRCMGDWLAETSDGAQIVTEKMVEVKRSSGSAMRLVSDAMKAELVSLKTTNDLVGAGDLEQEDAGALRQRRPATGRTAPSSNTGLKSPGKGKTTGGKS